MKIFQEKRRFRSRLYSKTAMIALILLILLIGKGVYDIFGRERESARMKKEAEAKLEELLGQRQSLESQSLKLSSEEGVDSAIRSKFNVVKPGEKVALIVESATTTSTSSPGFFASLWAKIWQ